MLSKTFFSPIYKTDDDDAQNNRHDQDYEFAKTKPDFQKSLLNATAQHDQKNRQGISVIHTVLERECDYALAHLHKSNETAANQKSTIKLDELGTYRPSK